MCLFFRERSLALRGRGVLGEAEAFHSPFSGEKTKGGGAGRMKEKNISNCKALRNKSERKIR
jgi:hypothetical protein